MKKAPMFGIIALLVAGLAIATAFAMPFGSFGKGNLHGSKDALRQALEAKDYSAYMTSLEESWNSYKARMTEEKFNQMVEHKKNIDGKKDEMHQANEEIQKAIENNDYNAWKQVTSSSGGFSRISELITEDNFGTYAKLHQAKQDKDWETIRQLSQDLGLEGPMNRFDRNSMMPRIGRFRQGFDLE